MIPTDEKLYQYQCNVFDKSFSSNSKDISIMSVKSFFFSTNGNLKVHMMTHTSKKPHQCSTCDK